MDAADHDALTGLLHSSMPLCRTLGMQAIEFSPERVVVEMPWSEELTTAGGGLHGGALMALADASGAAVAAVNLPDGAVGTSTIESKTNFIAGLTEGVATAVSTPLHVGSMTIVIETSIRSGDRLIAKVTQTQAVLRPTPSG